MGGISDICRKKICQTQLQRMEEAAQIFGFLAGAWFYFLNSSATQTPHCNAFPIWYGRWEKVPTPHAWYVAESHRRVVEIGLGQFARSTIAPFSLRRGQFPRIRLGLVSWRRLAERLGFVGKWLFSPGELYWSREGGYLNKHIPPPNFSSTPPQECGDEFLAQFEEIREKEQDDAKTRTSKQDQTKPLDEKPKSGMDTSQQNIDSSHTNSSGSPLPAPTDPPRVAVKSQL
jgi:hypothetical protein